jgi:hypothetical protein
MCLRRSEPGSRQTFLWLRLGLPCTRRAECEMGRVKQHLRCLCARVAGPGAEGEALGAAGARDRP